MIAVIDVCGAVEILLSKEKANNFSKTLKEATLKIAPDLYISELTNTLWKFYNAKILTKEKCVESIKDGIGFVDSFMDANYIWEEAFAEGVDNNHSIYDMFYMVTARRNNAVLITNDSALAAICKKNRVQVCF